jgi:hypothetical protein
MHPCFPDCPIGQINCSLSAAPPVQPRSQKFSAFAVGQISFRSPAVPRSSGGADRDRHGTLARDAMDAAASGAIYVAPDQSVAAYGEVVWYQRRRFEVPAVVAACLYRELQIESGAGISNLLVPLAFRSSLAKVLQR